MVRTVIACCAAVLIAAVVFSGGLRKSELQTGLPSPWYTYDGDIQYFAPGPEFKLSREAAAQKASKSDDAARRGNAARNY